MKSCSKQLFFGASRKNRQSFARLKICPQLFERFVFWEQIWNRNVENFCQKYQFAIRHAAQLRFKFSERTDADAPALQLQFLSKNRLRPVFAVAIFPHLRANDVQSQLHFARLSANQTQIYSHMRMKNNVIAFIGEDI